MLLYAASKGKELGLWFLKIQQLQEKIQAFQLLPNLHLIYIKKSNLRNHNVHFYKTAANVTLFLKFIVNKDSFKTIQKLYQGPGEYTEVIFNSTEEIYMCLHLFCL